ncbi:hypothetical protein BD770DRAFT_414600 [Pilaira anomala]|nr:hypothetical protein BD770DRAFT_414600 [Pilaira anomala]
MFFSEKPIQKIEELYKGQKLYDITGLSEYVNFTRNPTFYGFLFLHKSAFPKWHAVPDENFFNTWSTRFIEMCKEPAEDKKTKALIKEICEFITLLRPIYSITEDLDKTISVL